MNFENTEANIAKLLLKYRQMSTKRLKIVTKIFD